MASTVTTIIVAIPIVIWDTLSFKKLKLFPLWNGWELLQTSSLWWWNPIVIIQNLDFVFNRIKIIFIFSFFLIFHVSSLLLSLFRRSFGRKVKSLFIWRRFIEWQAACNKPAYLKCDREMPLIYLQFGEICAGSHHVFQTPPANVFPPFFVLFLFFFLISFLSLFFISKHLNFASTTILQLYCLFVRFFFP